MTDEARVRFNKPPVVEVACGVLFRTPSPLRGAHVGRYWDLVRDRFPRIEEAPPLSPMIEGQGGSSVVDFSIGFGLMPSLRRTWLLSEDGRSLLQIQEDRFLFNWKKASADDKYPSYDEVVAAFEGRLGEFENFLILDGVGQPIYRQFELTYVNHILIGSNDAGLEVDENRLLVDHFRDAHERRFLPTPEGINWTTVYALPNQEGRLYVTAQSTSAPDGRRILRLDMTARGMTEEVSAAARRTWFDQAHVWITHGFVDVTAPEIQQTIWERTA